MLTKNFPITMKVFCKKNFLITIPTVCSLQAAWQIRIDQSHCMQKFTYSIHLHAHGFAYYSNSKLLSNFAYENQQLLMIYEHLRIVLNHTCKQGLYVVSIKTACSCLYWRIGEKKQ